MAFPFSIRAIPYNFYALLTINDVDNCMPEVRLRSDETAREQCNERDLLHNAGSSIMPMRKRK